MKYLLCSLHFAFLFNLKIYKIQLQRFTNQSLNFALNFITNVTKSSNNN